MCSCQEELCCFVVHSETRLWAFLLLISITSKFGKTASQETWHNLSSSFSIQNVFLTQNGKVKLGDFGSARLLSKYVSILLQ